MVSRGVGINRSCAPCMLPTSTGAQVRITSCPIMHGGAVQSHSWDMNDRMTT